MAYFVLVFSFSSIVPFAFAEDAPPEPCTTQTEDQSCVIPPRIPKPDLLPGPSAFEDTGNVHERYFLTDLIPTLVRSGINLLGGLTVVALMYGGIQYIIAYGDDTKSENAKKTIQYALIGLLIALFSYTIVAIISTIPLSSRNDVSAPAVDTITTETTP